MSRCGAWTLNLAADAERIPVNMFSRFCHWPPVIRSAAFCLFCLALSAPALRADFAKGLAAYRARDFATAHREFRESAEAGEAPAMLSLAFLYLHGEGVAVNYKEAVHWLELAAEKGLAPAQHGGSRLLRGQRRAAKLPRSPRTTLNRPHCRVWRTPSITSVCSMRAERRGAGLGAGPVLARESGRSGVTDSELALGAMYANGGALPEITRRRRAGSAKAASRGNAKARRALETFGEPASPRKRFGQRQFRTSARKQASGFPRGLPVSRRNGWRKVPERLEAAAFQALQARAVSGDAAAQLELAIHYYHGGSVKRNLLRAYVWAKRAALKGVRREAMSRGCTGNLTISCESWRNVCSPSRRPPDREYLTANTRPRIRDCESLTRASPSESRYTGSRPVRCL